LSTILERRQLCDLSVSGPSDDIDATRVRHSTPWTNLITAHAVPVVTALALVWLATIGLVVLSDFVPLNLVPLIYMLPVVLAAAQWGIVPALIAAVAGAAAADFFFYPPLYSFRIHDPRHVIDLALFLVVAIVTSITAACLRSEMDTSRRRAGESNELHAFPQGLATCRSGGNLHADNPGSNPGATMSLRLPTASEDTPVPMDAING
jgi:K+-sensing histidine kinase KdpD